MKKLYRITTIPLSLEKLLGSQLTFINQHYKVTAVAAEPLELKRVAEQLHVDYETVDMTRKITPLQDFKALIQLYRLLKRDRPEIVHTHTPKAGIVGMLAAKLAGVPIRMHTVAGLPLMEAQGLKRKILDFVEKLTYACATHVYPNSKGLADFILQEKLTHSRKIKIIANGSSNGIDTAYFSPSVIPPQTMQDLRTELQITSEDFVFVFVGRLVGDKGINELVKAFSQLQTPNTKLLLVGPLESDLDPLLPETLKMIQHPNIIHVGYQQDVRPYFAIANALVFPSYREGFPNVVMQAGAMGLPSIVSNINGCNEIIIDKENGIIIPVKDTKAILNAMTTLLEEPELYQHLQKNSRSMICDRYEQKVVWNALLEEYNMLTSSLK